MNVINIFAELGHRLESFGNEESSRHIIAKAIAENGWFTEEDILRSVEAIRSTMLRVELLTRWSAQYTTANKPQSVAIIMAGNIPLVGFFDLLCVVVSGHRCYIKPSSKDRVLMRYVVELLHGIDPTIDI